jgi:enoyl-CoA hydratase/carnithine racemase
MNEFLSIERAGPILTLTMNHPKTRNALTGNSAADEVVAACQLAARDV